MTSQTIEQRYRTFLLLLSGFMCLGTIVELWLEEHTETAVQLIPFILCGLGFLIILWVLFSTNRTNLLILRGTMLLVGLGSIFGVYEHIEHNLAFELEIRPTAAVSDVFMEALKGASPLLAPGILGLAALIALAATYYHPVLVKRENA
jgi:hypothetical protein